MLKKKLVSKKQPYGANNSIEYFIGYNDDDVIILIIMSFKVADDKLLKSTPKYEKNSYLVGKEFDNEPVNGDNDKYIGTKIKVYGDKVNTNFPSKKYPNKILQVSVCH